MNKHYLIAISAATKLGFRNNLVNSLYSLSRELRMINRYSGEHTAKLFCCSLFSLSKETESTQLLELSEDTQPKEFENSTNETCTQII